MANQDMYSHREEHLQFGNVESIFCFCHVEHQKGSRFTYDPHHFPGSFFHLNYMKNGNGGKTFCEHVVGRCSLLNLRIGSKPVEHCLYYYKMAFQGMLRKLGPCEIKRDRML